MADGLDILKPIVLDNGGDSIKAGFAGDDIPCSVFASVFGRPRHPRYMPGLPQKDSYVGIEALCKRGILTLKHPIRCGIINDWDEMEKIWHHTFYNELRVAPELHPVLLTEKPLNPKTNREKTTEIMFEAFRVPAMYLALQSVLSLNASCHSTGLVIESGEGVSHTVPICEGHALPQAISKLDLAGFDITYYMISEISQYLYNRGGDVDELKIEDKKKTIAYVALDYDKELELARTNPASLKMIYTLYDGFSYPVCSERFRCPEVLFRPSLVGMESSGIHEKAHDSIMKCDADIRERMYNTIVLSGGSTLFPGFAKRVTREISARAPNNLKAKVIAPDNRKYSAWIGGSIMASKNTFQPMWISRSEYNEYGPAIVHRKCL